LGKFKGIVFELDGTLVHSDVDFTKMKENMIRVLEEHGVPKSILTPKMTTVVIMEYAEKYWAELKKTESERKWLREEMTRLMDSGELEAIDTLKPILGVEEAIRLLKKKGYRLGILTRSHHAYAVEALKKMKILDYFEAVLGREETPQPKPYADAMIYSAKALGLQLDEVFLVGDHHIDSTCAVNAGCHFIGVATGLRGDKSWEINRPQVILPSVADLPDYLEKNDQ
jgi:phosphoglycolate phosphatase-like HAD superfamily hydrolase